IALAFAAGEEVFPGAQPAAKGRDQHGDSLRAGAPSSCRASNRSMPCCGSVHPLPRAWAPGSRRQVSHEPTWRCAGDTAESFLVGRGRTKEAPGRKWNGGENTDRFSRMSTEKNREPALPSKLHVTFTIALDIVGKFALRLSE